MIEEKSKQMKGKIKNASYKLDMAERQYKGEMVRFQRELQQNLKQ